MNYYKIGICDDEEIILNNVTELIIDKLNKIECCYDLTKFTNPLHIINSHFESNFDIVFLDIDMPVLNGIEVAQAIKINNPNTFIIFITGKDELVFESFKVQPFRFIRKSKLKDEISEAILEAYKLLQVNSYKVNFMIENVKYDIDINGILYIESSRNYITINTINNKKFKYKDSINKKAKELEKYGFIRTHVAYLVNQKYIQRIENNDVIIKTYEKIPISRSHIRSVKQKLIEYLGEI